MPDLQLIVTDERQFLRTVDWNLFQLFLEIVESGGISAAARRLNRQQPTISAALKRLEDHLGAELCLRTSHGIELTAAGRALVPMCETMLGAVRAIPRAVATAANRIEGKIGIRTISSVVCPEFDAAVSAFHGAHPGVEVHLEVAPWREVVKAIYAGEAEIGVACDSAPISDLHYVPLIKETQQLYCGRMSPLFGKAIERPSDLVRESFILTGDDEPEELAQFRRRFGLGLRVGGFAENLHEVRRLIELGIGIGFLPTSVGGQPADAGLWPLLPPHLLPAYHVFLITRDRSERDAPTELLVDEIMRRLRLR
jgi:DNA-binding transcriptional LysR family regulator